MWFPPYPAPSIARSALPDAPVRDDRVQDDPAPPFRFRRRSSVKRGWRWFPARRPATPRPA